MLVLELSELEVDEDSGIIIAVKERFKEGIEKNINSKDIKNYIWASDL